LDKILKMIEFLINNKDFILLLLIGLTFTAIGFYKNYKIDTIRKTGIKTEAQIVDYIRETDHSSDRISTYYHALISFTDSKGISRHIKEDFGTSMRPNKQLPYPIKIAYLETNGEFEIATESKFTDFVAMFFLIMGMIVTITTLFFRFFI